MPRSREYLNYTEARVTITVELSRHRSEECVAYTRTSTSPLNLTGREGQRSHIRGIVERRVQEFVDEGIPEIAKEGQQDG